MIRRLDRSLARWGSAASLLAALAGCGSTEPTSAVDVRGVWGGTAASDVPHTGTGTETSLTVYGRIPAGQNVPAGSYSDTVVATVTF